MNAKLSNVKKVQVLTTVEAVNEHLNSGWTLYRISNALGVTPNDLFATEQKEKGATP